MGSKSITTVSTSTRTQAAQDQGSVVDVAKNYLREGATLNVGLTGDQAVSLATLSAGLGIGVGRQLIEIPDPAFMGSAQPAAAVAPSGGQDRTVWLVAAGALLVALLAGGVL